MSEREHRAPAQWHAPARVLARDRTGPPGIAGILGMQRRAGNDAVASALAGRDGATPAAHPLGMIQRTPPTRAEMIAALKREITDAKADATKWKDVALRLNGFDKGDFRTMVAEIPAAHLQPARSAVERELVAGPAQTGLLTAIDARARNKNVSLRPLGSSIWAAYSQVGYNVWSGESLKNKVWEHIGGSVGKKYVGGNTCAARVSWSFNYGGFPVAGRGEVNESRKSYKGKSGDDKVYIVWVPSLQSYLTAIWGAPDAMLATNAEAVTFEAALSPGEVAVFAGPHHSGLIKQGYSDAYVKSDPGVMPVAAWKLPM